jgi:hypothetical protein
MNRLIHDYFDAIEARLIASPIVATFDVIRREITPTDGKIRIRATLTDGGLLELFEYVAEDQGQLNLQKYSFHWQDAKGELAQRWDNVNHHPDLPNAPHHVHQADGSVQSVLDVPGTIGLLDEVENKFLR